MEVFGTDSFLAWPRRKMFLVGSVARGIEMVICFGSAPFTPVAVVWVPIQLMLLLFGLLLTTGRNV